MNVKVMRLLAALLLFIALTACTEPRLGANFGFGTGGVSFTPSLSGRVGGARLLISG